MTFQCCDYIYIYIYICIYIYDGDIYHDNFQTSKFLGPTNVFFTDKYRFLEPKNIRYRKKVTDIKHSTHDILFFFGMRM